MKRSLLFPLALVFLAGCSDGGDSSSTGGATLLTLDAGSGSLTSTGARRYDLVLDDASRLAVAFSDRPVREATLVPIEDLVADWADNGWDTAPPAALLTVRDAGGGTWIEAFTLGEPVLEGEAVHFSAESLDEVVAIPATFADVDLFLQPQGTAVAGGRVFSLPGNGGTFTPTSSSTWTLAIDDVSPIAAYLWTGTPPDAGPIATGTFLAAWSSYGFDTLPPNASITVRAGGETAVAVVTLADPVYDADASTLRFTATDVDGGADLPASFTHSDLFIDSVGGAAAKSTAFTKRIGVDYDSEARCSDDDWTSSNPAACNPQPSFMCDDTDNLALCPARCQACFDADLAQIKGLGVGAIMIYNPNYYALKAAQAQSVKVLLGTWNDTLPGLAQPDAPSGCTYSGFPTACGATYARYLIDGACGDQSPWDPNRFCSGGTFITPWKAPLDDGTVIGIQIGNEVLAAGYTVAQIAGAAQTLRGVLDSRGYTAEKVPIVISLVLGNEKKVCAAGAPPANVDFIAAHPYCTNVAGLPPSWPASGTACLEQVKRDFADISQKECGAANVFIGETGFNTGCPNVYGTQYAADATAFVGGATQWACESSLGLFHFAYVDACPQGGCLAGCASQPLEGNGYFGLYSTQGHLTKGPLVPKLSPMPSLVCPLSLTRDAVYRGPRSHEAG